MNIAHILPVNLTSNELRQNTEMYLTHMIQKYPLAYNHLQRDSEFGFNSYKILDNSNYELKSPMDFDKVLDAACYIKASAVVLPDKLFSTETVEVTKAAALSLPTGRKFETFGVVQGPTMGDCLNVFDRLMNLDCVDIIAVPKYIAEYSYGGFGRRDFVNRVTARYGHDCKVMHLLGLKYGLWELAGMDDSSVMSMDTSYFVMQATEHVNVMETRRAGWEANLEKADTTFEELYNRFQYIDRIKDSILQRRV